MRGIRIRICLVSSEDDVMLTVVRDVWGKEGLRETSAALLLVFLFFLFFLLLQLLLLFWCKRRGPRFATLIVGFQSRIEDFMLRASRHHTSK